MDSSTIQSIITIVSIIVGSGLIQFFFNRRDKRIEDAKKDQIEILRKEFKEGLDEREKTGKNRYDEHHISIERMNIQHQKDLQALREAVHQLTENDTRITQSLDRIADKQEIMAESLVGQAHDRIIFLTDKISERGAVTIKEKATLKSMYNPYSRLGGNGHCATAMNHVDTLPVVSEDEAKAMDIKMKNNQRTIV